MIFSECINCNSAIIINWEIEDGGSYYRNECEKCKSISFYECTSFPYLRKNKYIK